MGCRHTHTRIHSHNMAPPTKESAFSENVQQSQGTIYKNLWPDLELQSFKDDRIDMIEDERLMCSGASVGRIICNKTATALSKMGELHYELKHMHDIERRQIEEIDKLRERFKDSENKLHHLGEIQTALEMTIVELKSELHDTRKQSADRKSTIELRDKQLVSAADNAKVDQKIFNEKLAGQNKQKDEEIKKLEENLTKTKAENEALTKTVAQAEHGATVLKDCITKCADSLLNIGSNEAEGE